MTDPKLREAIHESEKRAKFVREAEADQRNSSRGREAQEIRNERMAREVERRNGR